MKMTTFQVVVLAIFGLFVVLGIGFFATYGAASREKTVGSVSIWGTEDGQTVQNLLAELKSENKEFEDVTYTQQDPSTYESTLINAMATGSGPDLFLISQDDLVSFSDKIDVTPYSDYSQAMYLSSFIDEGQLFLTPQGILAFPFSINPLVTYWNKDLLASAGIAQPPQYWSDLLTLAPKITSIDPSSNVTRSAVALGEWTNVSYAKYILSSLIMQAGDPIVTRDTSGNLVAEFGATPQNAASNPASSAVLFYTEFADPTKTTYSWNRSLPNSFSAFAAGQLAIYFGLASDYAQLQQTNPNLNFGVALLPQIQGNATQETFGELTGLAISRTSKNPSGAFAIAEALSGSAMQQELTQATGLPTVRRDITENTSADAASTVFAQSALIAHGWLDPSASGTNTLFQGMIESVLSGEEDPAGAVGQASQAVQQLVSAQQ